MNNSQNTLSTQELETMIESIQNMLEGNLVSKFVKEQLEYELELLQKEYLIEMEDEEGYIEEYEIDEAVNGDLLFGANYL